MGHFIEMKLKRRPYMRFYEMSSVHMLYTTKYVNFVDEAFLDPSTIMFLLCCRLAGAKFKEFTL